MYIKITCVEQQGDEIAARVYREQTYECENYKYTEIGDEATLCIIRHENDGGYDITQIDKVNTAIYIMNDDGKTIDSYRWKQGDNRIVRL